jgi:predicted transcriptional regulator of viral defense system
MKFNELLRIAGGEAFFSSALLYAGLESPNNIRAQLSRWVKEGKLIKLRRTLYAITPDYSGVTPDLFIVANALVTPSYVSCQTALAWHGVIPEASVSVTSVTSGRSCIVTNALGTFIYRHVVPELLWGYENIDTERFGQCRVALPEKALLDLVYLEPRGDSVPFLRQLRMSDENISLGLLKEFAERWGRKKMLRAAGNTVAVLSEEVP